MKTAQQKRELLRRLVELMIYCGYDVTDLMGRPLSYFNWDNIENSIGVYNKEKREIDGIKQY